MTVRVTKLDNGLRIVTDEMSRVETVTVGMWVGSGTRDEEEEVNGVAHFLEHMAFKGTQRRTARNIAEEIETVGGYLNAYTSREHTAYYAKVLKEDIELAIDMLADILQFSVFDSTELARERAVILQEIGQSLDTPDDIVFDSFQSTAFPDQPLGWPVLGRSEVVNAMPRKQIMEYMQQTYSSDRMVLCAVGNVGHENVVNLANMKFQNLSRSKSDKARLAQYCGGDHRTSRDLEQIHLVIGFPSVAYYEESYFAASVLSTLLGGGMSSRLFQEIRERRGLAYSIYSYNSSYRDCGLMGIYAGTGASEITELLPVLCDEICALPDTLNENEVRRARNQIKASLLMSLESNSARAEQLAQQLLIFGKPIPLEEMVARVEAVDVQAVSELAKSIFVSKPTMAAIGPLERLEPYAKVVSRLVS